jgi:uncharacterized membrane protein
MDTPGANREPRDFRLGEDPMEIKDNKVILRDEEARQLKWMYRTFYALMFLPLVITLIALPILPDKVPMHYNLRNEIDR